MRIGIEIKSFKVWQGTHNVMIHIPFIQIGYFSDPLADGDHWSGVRIDLCSEISFEKYDYGTVYKIKLLGFGIEYTKTLF